MNPYPRSVHVSADRKAAEVEPVPVSDRVPESAPPLLPEVPALGHYQPPVMPAHRKRLATELAQRLPQNANVLYIGADNGEIANGILDRRTDVMMRACIVGSADDFIGRMAYSMFDGRHLAHRDRAFDAIVFVDILHRLEEPEALLREGRRCARKIVLVKDCKVDLDGEPTQTVRLVHWMHDLTHPALSHRHYLSHDSWIALFEATALGVIAIDDRLSVESLVMKGLMGSRFHFIAELLPPAAASAAAVSPSTAAPLMSPTT